MVDVDVDGALEALANLLGAGEPPTANLPKPPGPAPPWPPWTGIASDSARLVTTRLDGLRTRIYNTQLDAVPIINEAGQVTRHAREQMTKIRQAWAADKRALAPLQGTLTGKLALLAAGQRRLAEAGEVIRRAVGDFTTLSQRLGGVAGDLPLAPGPGGPLPPGAQDLGPIAGTGANPGIDGIGAADLGEIIRLPDGRLVAIFGDSFTGKNIGEGQHYRSVAVLVTGFDDQGRPIFGERLSGLPGSGRELFPLDAIPQQAKDAGAVDTLPAGSITVGKDTYMMVVGTDADLHPVGGSWLVQVTNDPGAGWRPIDRSWRPWQPGSPIASAPPTQISGYKGSDGMVYIAADSFNRGMNDGFHGVTMYRVDPGTVADRSTWQPWTGSGWGAADAAPAPLTNSDFGELSFREIDGHPVLSGFDRSTGNVEVRVANDPVQIFGPAAPTTVIAQQLDRGAPNYVFQNYGGYIVPDSTLDNLGILVSKWGEGDYNVRIFRANVPPPP